jgi:hypothetical protein
VAEAAELGQTGLEGDAGLRGMHEGGGPLAREGEVGEEGGGEEVGQADPLVGLLELVLVTRRGVGEDFEDFGEGKGAEEAGGGGEAGETGEVGVELAGLWRWARHDYSSLLCRSNCT